MEDHEVVLRPVITEFVYDLIEKENKIMFEVAKDANKYVIKRAVQNLYNVRVEKVNTYITPKGIKRAICKLQEAYNAYDLAVDLSLFG
ncbi:MAG: 50S ribosomal protein L23 [Candidatus Heimdallarchaeota archaeon]|nr:50S ribosomal protein L23 [Candidatus Heimdallarchaeota archaeon]